MAASFVLGSQKILTVRLAVRRDQRHCRLTVSPARRDVALFLHRAVRLAGGFVGSRFELP